MSSSSEAVTAEQPTSFVRDDFAFQQLPPAPPAPRRVDPAIARNEAAQILAAAQAEAEQIREQARLQGHAEGYEAGRADAAAQCAPAVQALAETLAQAQAERERVAEHMEESAVGLGLQIADKALTGAITAQPERVVDVVRGALRCLVERERVTILVNPQDLPIVRDAVAGLIQQLGGIEHLEVQEERRVHRGGAMVRSTTGEIDARIETKLDRAREILQAELSRQSTVDSRQ
jgi:flagellar biosynthesis/type III secretory pathway protein FliH